MTRCPTSLIIREIQSKSTMRYHLMQVRVQFSSVAQLCQTLCNPMDCSMPGLPVHHQLAEFTQLMFIETVVPSNHLMLCLPLLLPPSIFPSIRAFSNESVLHIRWPKYWSFNFSISPSNEYSGPISFRMDWLDLLAAQGTLKSLLQHHSLKASILWCSAFFRVQLLHLYISSVQLSRSVVSNSVTPWTAACQASLSITNSCSLLKLMSIELVMPSNHLMLCLPLLLPPAIFPSIRVFSNE